MSPVNVVWIMVVAAVLAALQGKTLATAESLTGGGIGAALTSVPGASAVYMGGVVSYTNEIKQNVLGVSPETLKIHGAVSCQTAQEMAVGVRKLLHTDDFASLQQFLFDYSENSPVLSTKSKNR